MENKLTISAVTSLMAESTGRSRRSCEDFIKEFFNLTTEILASGENVRIKGFGTFKIIDVEARNGVNVNTGEKQQIEAHKRVVFTPSKEMASLINKPFELFESVEIDDSIPSIEYEVEMTDNKDEVMEEKAKSENENNIDSPILESGSMEEDFDDSITYEAYKDIEEQENNQIMESKNNQSVVFAQESADENSLNHPVEPEVVYVAEPGKYGKGFFAGAMTSLVVCLLIFMIGCFLGWWPVNFGSMKSIVAQNPAEEQVVTDPPVEVIEESQPVFDTVTKTRFLTTIAREHYGNFNFWPYIYLENESILGHPDRITPGTQIVVPPLSKYGIEDTENKEAEETAKKKGVEIYAKYK